MGRRIQPRFKGVLPVRIWGTDHEGEPFAEHVCTMDISNKGASLAGVRAHLLPGDTLGVQYRNRQARFRVMWVAPARVAPGKHVGLECMQPEKELWPMETPDHGPDDFVLPDVCLARKTTTRGDHRSHMRFPVSGTAYLTRIGGGEGISTKLGDISLTGCYLHTNKGLEVGRRVSLSIKIGQDQFQAVGIVRARYSRIATGIEFTFMSSADRRILERLIEHLKEVCSDETHA
jgi:PilZ domain